MCTPGTLDSLAGGVLWVVPEVEKETGFLFGFFMGIGQVPLGIGDTVLEELFYGRAGIATGHKSIPEELQSQADVVGAGAEGVYSEDGAEDETS